MKKVLLLLMLITIGYISQAQIMLGYSLYDIRKEMEKEGYIIKTGESTTGDIHYLTAYSNKLFKAYYFSEDNVCIAYAVFMKLSKKDLESLLIENGYWKVGKVFQNGEFECEVLYSEDIKEYYMYFTYQ